LELKVDKDLNFTCPKGCNSLPKNIFKSKKIKFRNCLEFGGIMTGFQLKKQQVMMGKVLLTKASILVRSSD